MLANEILPTLGRFILSKTLPARYAVDELLFCSFASTAPLSRLKDAWRGKPALVVANGPSLNQTPLDEFAGAHSIGMNKIDLIFPRTRWRPSLIVCENSMVARQHAAPMAALDIPVFLSWKSKGVLPRRLRAEFSYYLTRNSGEFSTDIAHGLGAAATVTFVALQFAFHTGANPVVIVGCDHNFKFEGKARSYIKMEGDDPNHFAPNYFANGTIWGAPDLELSEQGYGAALETFRAHDRQIYDATIGGKLTVFPKISIDEARRLLKPGEGDA